MERLDRSAPLPDIMQGRWVDAEDPTSQLVISGGEITCFDRVVDYDFKEVGEDDGATTVSLRVSDNTREDDFQRANITELVWTSDGEFYAYNTRFASQFVRAAA